MALRVIYATNRVLPYQIHHRRRVETVSSSAPHELKPEPSMVISVRFHSKKAMFCGDSYLRHQLAMARIHLSVDRNYKQYVVEKILSRIEHKVVPEYAVDMIKQKLYKLEYLDSGRYEFEYSKNHLNWLTSLPWGMTSQENFDLLEAAKILDEDLYGQEKAKEYILAIMAGWERKGNVHGNILCFFGEPGVGKATLARSTARALNRKFCRFSINEMKDAAMKGKNKSSGAVKPGKVIQCLQKVQTFNPLILIEEIDELGESGLANGISTTEILAFLDPEKNSAFVDPYLQLPVNLSEVLFICTACDKDAVRKSLRNRMEFIEIPGYSAKEKQVIAVNRKLPKILKEFKLKEEQVTIAYDDLTHLIEKSGSALGIPDLHNFLVKMVREAALRILKNGPFPQDEKPISKNWKLVNIVVGYCLISVVVFLISTLGFKDLELFQLSTKLSELGDMYQSYWQSYVRRDE